MGHKTALHNFSENCILILYRLIGNKKYCSLISQLWVLCLVLVLFYIFLCAFSFAVISLGKLELVALLYCILVSCGCY